MRVFISSTVYDLLDVRAELCALLRSIGAAPVLSDDKLSDFTISHDANSIETCLVNVDSSNAMIVVLDKRYGPKLGACGFEDVSATHLEYRRAKKWQKDIFFFVRDRLEADFAIWRKNKSNSNLKLSWVDERNIGLFDLMEEHRALHATSSSNNWHSSFTTSIDLKEAIQRQLSRVVRPQAVVDAIAKNNFPIFAVDHEAKIIPINRSPALMLTVNMTNVGGSPGFNFHSQSLDDEVNTERKSEVVAPKQLVTFVVLVMDPYRSGYRAELSIEFDSVVGVQVQDDYLLHVSFPGGPGAALLSAVSFKKRTYRHTSRVEVVIEDAAA